MGPQTGRVERIRTMIRHIESKTTSDGGEVYRIPTSMYRDPERWTREVDIIFRSRPIALALSAELKMNNDYKALELVGVPVLVQRGPDGRVRAFMNSCRHRGAMVAQAGTGNKNRHVCPYHGWSYDQFGCLRGILAEKTFGPVDKSELGLTEIPSEERHGIVWGILTPGADLDLDDWLGTAGPELEKLHLADLHHFSTKILKGPNWKVAMDGYHENYHFSILHPETFNQTLYSNVSQVENLDRHQRIYIPRRGILGLKDMPEDQWDSERWLAEALLVFPNCDFAFALLPGAKDDQPEYGRHCLAHMVYPGSRIDESITYQVNLTTKPITNDSDRQILHDIAESSANAVANEDYWVGGQITQALPYAAPEFLMFGRNEEALTHFHRTVDKLLKEA